jgi:hypothetical protein
MSRGRCILAISIVISFSLFLCSCGSSSSRTVTTGQIPVFSSVAPTAAAQGVAYSYTVEAVDPSGGTVSYALTTGPTGATLSGATVSWTPTAAQSRTSNNFSVTATTSENSSAMQSWTVSPTGIITVNDVTTYWEPSGPTQVPAFNDASLAISAVVPNPDGSLTVLPGQLTSAGVISIPGVPAGNYWLAFGSGALLPTVSSAYWTNSTTVDAGRDVPGSPLAFTSSSNTTSFAFNVSGLDSVEETSDLIFNPEIQVAVDQFGVLQDSTTFTQTLGFVGDFDWSQSPTVFLMQTVPQTIGPSGTQLSLAVAGPAATISSPAFVDGATNPVTATLGIGAEVSYDINVLGSTYISTFTSAGPAPATPYASAFAYRVEPFMNTTTAPQDVADDGSLPLVKSVLLSGIGSNPIAPLCDSSGFEQSTLLQPAITTDVDLGSVMFVDGFPSSWIRPISYCTEATVPIAVPGSSSTVNFALVTSATGTSESTGLAPAVSQVLNPTINNASLFTAATLSTTTPSFSWSAPSQGTAYGYRISLFVYDPGDFYQYIAVGSFYTSTTSITLPPLSAGNTYVFSITALADGAANIQTSPFRSALPTGYASVVSAPMTISAGAASPEIRGDASVLKRFTQPTPPEPGTKPARKS